MTPFEQLYEVVLVFLIKKLKRRDGLTKVPITSCCINLDFSLSHR